LTTQTLLNMGQSIEEIRASMDKMPVTTAQMLTGWSNAFAKMISNSDTFKELWERFNRSMLVSAGKFGDLFDDSEIKKATDSIGTYQEKIDSLTETQGELANLIIIGGSKEEAGFFNRMFLDSERADVKLTQVNSEIKHYIKLIKEAELVIQNVTFGQQFEGPPAPTVAGTTGKKGKKDDSVASLLKAFNEEQSKANKFIEQAANLFSAGKINLEEYLHIYNKYIDASGKDIGEATKFLEVQKELNSLWESSLTPLEQYVEEQNRLSEIIALYPELAEKAMEVQRRSAEEFKESSTTDAMKDNIIDWSDVASNAIGDVADSFVDMAMSGKASFSDFAQSFIVDITKMILKQQLMLALVGKDGTSGLIGGFLTPSAKGNVFENGSVTPFANGGIVSSPTIFPMANGAGLMGEAGPEAIMPLSRKNGKLGVDASNTGVTVNVNNYNGSNVTTKESTDAQGNKSIDVIIEEKISASIQSGALDRQMGSTYGVRRRGY